MSVPFGNTSPPQEPTSDKPILVVKSLCRRLILGQVKAGKTFAEIMRMFKMKHTCFSIIVTINQKASRDQTKEQALEVGFKEEDIILPGDLKKQNNKYGPLRAKILVVNLNENYDAKVSDIIAEAHRQGLIVNYTSDEYDCNAAILELKKNKTRHDIEQRWITALDIKDIFTCVSATNAVGYYAEWVKWTDIIQCSPWHPSYKSMTDIFIKTMDDFTAEELSLGIIGSSLINRIKNENNIKKKALIKVTNYVNWDEDNPKTHAHLLEQCLDAGINAVVMNGSSEPTPEEYDNAVVIIVGAMANRTREFKDIYTQYLDFGDELWDGAIIQALRLCGVRPYTPILYVSQSRLKRLKDAIENELNIMSADWTKPRVSNISKDSKPLPTKIAGQVRVRTKETPYAVIPLEEYKDFVTSLYPIIDGINYNESGGTRKYGDKSVTYIVESLVNIFSKDRIQPDRNLVLPNEEGVIPQNGIATSIKMGVLYEENMKRFASYYIDPSTYVLQVALWEISEKPELRDLFYVETKNRSAA